MPRGSWSSPAGMRECCDEFALSLVGGNLSRGGELSIVVTVTGEVGPGRAVRRSGAKPGDRVVVTGSLGGSAAGLRVASQRSWSDDERDALRLSCDPSRGWARRRSSRLTASPR